MITSTVLKKLSIATAGATFIALGTFSSAQAATMVLDFEGFGNLQSIGEFYNTAPHDFDISFSSNALALVDSDAGGSGTIGGEPSPDTVLFFINEPAATLNVANGFTTGFSFFYSAVNNPGFIKVYDGLNATGNILASLDLPLTPFNGAPDPSGAFSPFVPIGVAFAGNAYSVDFGGTADQIVFDDIIIGAAAEPVPEPLTILGSGLALGFGSLMKRQQSRKLKKTSVAE
jgi:hypothetical protein